MLRDYDNVHFFTNQAFPSDCDSKRDERQLLIKEWCTTGGLCRKGCGTCFTKCTSGALRMENNIPKISLEHCVLCGQCIVACKDFMVRIV